MNALYPKPGKRVCILTLVNLALMFFTSSCGLADLLISILDEGDDPVTHSDTIPIRGKVWEDENENGIRDAFELGVEGAIVRLYLVSAEGVLSLVEERITMPNGDYEFSPQEFFKNFKVEFIAPENYFLTDQDRGNDESMDSDPDPVTGLTETFTGVTEDASKGLYIFLAQDAGLLKDSDIEEVFIGDPDEHTETPEPTTSPTPTETPSPTATSGPTATPTLENETFEDEQADDVICADNSLSNDPQVDLDRVRVFQDNEGGRFIVEVITHAPLTDDYSFAILIIINGPGGPIAFVWEIHNGVYRVGELDLQTGNVTPLDDPGSTFTDENLITDDGLVIGFDREAGQASFAIPRSIAPETRTDVQVQSFHSPTENDETRCDTAGPFVLPERMQRFPEE